MPQRENPELKFGAPLSDREYTLFYKHLVNNKLDEQARAYVFSLPKFNIDHFPSSYPSKLKNEEYESSGLTHYQVASIANLLVKDKLFEEPKTIGNQLLFKTTDKGIKRINSVWLGVLHDLELKEKKK